MAEADIDRLAEKVAHLSTKLVTEVAKSSELEETILQVKRENSVLKSQVGELTSDASRAKTAESELAQLRQRLGQTEEEKKVAEEKNKQLEGEVEDLTASLFNEANEMVSNASRETYNFKVKNRKLYEEIDEKNAIIDSLQAQLQDLKGLFMKLEDQQRSSRHGTPQLEHGFDEKPTDNVVDDYGYLMSQLIHAPRVRAIRFDLNHYQHDFKAFVFQLIKPDFVFDLASLKTLKYFRKIWHEEIEPALGTIPSVSNNFLNRFSKGKTFWTLLAEGKAIIEPVSGVNETFKLNYRGVKTGDEKPVAMKEPCAFCGETKGDRLEHARLYMLKLYGPASETSITGDSSTTIISGEVHEVIGTYPLCNFCLVKLRAICEFFAKLRLVHANVYKLQQNSTFDDLAFVSQFKFQNYDRHTHTVDRKISSNDEAILIKLYYLLLTVRAKIFWSKVGFWDTEEDSETVTIEEAHIDIFQRMVKENSAFGVDRAEPIERPQSVNGDNSRKSDATDTEKETETSKTTQETTQDTAQAEDTEKKVEKEGNEDSDEGDFADAETFEQPLQRRKSKSKEFKKKIDQGLASTMEMLKESIDEDEKKKGN
ncbi:uncharacterized protein CXQ87_001695 [Candidozyma duobushaemuli]|uniref:GDP/GTP exchange factor Sec2 N-terminal domain-containing protein n=2 Tax=Candidozyma TaxID=3303203 RepID=A0ABX8I4F9_9ASCO|nr:uncharacterized protein CXQ87_001695 [[Candida] duobushaemulonis]PVH13587.1 hypothetical protein CXQ87_001695 [[Candida] duobushaemulonis]QWU88176.1 hypothetical protein CA3LBN_002441 [[Candida] haemuloni]